MDKYQYMSDPNFLKSLLEHMAEGIVILDKELNVLGVNKGFSNMFCWNEEEVKGLKANRLPIIPAHYEKEVQDVVGKMLTGQTLSGIETKRKRKDGTLLDVLVSYNPVLDDSGEVSGITMVFRDITSRKTAERMLQESEQRYKSLFDENPDAIFSLDLEGHFTSFNKNVLNLVQYSSDELQHMTFEPIVAPEYREETWKYFLESLNGEAVEYEIVIINKLGERIDIKVKNVPIKVEGEIVGIYGVAKDISNEKYALKEVHRVKEELELIWDHITDATFVISNEGSIVKINQSFTQKLGWSEDEIIGLSVLPIIPEHFREDHQNLIKRFQKGERISQHEHQRLTKDGMLIDVLASYTPIENREGKVVGTVGTWMRLLRTIWKVISRAEIIL